MYSLKSSLIIGRIIKSLTANAITLNIKWTMNTELGSPPVSNIIYDTGKVQAEVADWSMCADMLGNYTGRIANKIPPTTD